MASNPIAAEGTSMACRICGSRAARGAKLCTQCTAAVKRARQVPTIVSQFLPMSISRPLADAPDTAVQRSLRIPTGPRLVLPPFPGGWGAFTMLVTFGVAVCLTGYLAIHESDDEALGAPLAASPQATAMREPAAAGAAEPRPTAVATTEANPADAAIAATGGTVRPASIASPSRSASRGSNRDARASRSASRANAPDAQAPAAGMAPGPASQTRTGDGNEPVALLVANAQHPAPDRWQSMDAAIANCAKESFFVGVVCDQRVRWRYCDGYWGEVPQCPGGVRIDYRH